MKRCTYCNHLILFGGTKDGEMRFCNDRCHQNGSVLVASRSIPDEFFQKHVNEVHQGPCPVCHGRGPVDVHISHFVWSAFIVTRWSSSPKICCRGCGFKSQLLNSLGSLVVGWWGLPWGVVLTPIQVIRNLFEMFTPRSSYNPSDFLRKLVRINVLNI
jgi:hypothetical protein